MTETAVILFAYKRPRYLKKCLTSLKKAYDDRLVFNYYAFVDYSMMQNKIAQIIRESGLFDKIIKRDRCLGVDESIKRGVYEVLKDYNSVIVIEDDLVLEPEAIIYLKDNLDKYEDDKSVGQITLQGNFPHSHGWAIWKDKWEKIDWDLVPLFGHLAKQYKKQGATWDVIFHNNFNSLGWKAIGKKLAKHIGTFGVHYNILSKLSIRKYFKEDYYRDKDILMRNKTFICKHTTK